jgi:glutathione S-transferase
MTSTIDRGELLFFHSPNTRATGVHILLEELGATFVARPLNMKAGATREPAFLAVNPMGKVPAIVHKGALVTEQGAIFTYLGDLFPEAGITPKFDASDRGPYLRWMFYYGSCFEPAILDKYMKNAPAPQGTSPYGSYETTIDILAEQLRKGPYLLGERFSAVDILWATALGWTTSFKLVPELPEFTAYVARIKQRPAVARVDAYNTKLAAEYA